MKKRIFISTIALLFIFLNSSSVRASQVINVEYRGDTEKIFKTSDDFFVNVPTLLPGDIIEDNAVLYNKSNSNINLYFKTEPYDKDEYELDEDYRILEEIKLSIFVRKNKELLNVYDGVLGSKDFIEFKNIGTFAPEEKANFIFKLEVPKELKNEFDMTCTKVKWTFGIEKDDISKEVLGNKVIDKNDDKKNHLKNNVNTSFVQTSDESQVSLLLYMTVLSMLFFGLVRKEQRR